MQTTGPHDLHRLRRVAINPFFSKRQINILWPYILSKCENLSARIEGAFHSNTVFPLTNALGCFTFDVITEYSFGNCSDELKKPDLSPEINKVREQQIGQVHVITHFPWLLSFMNSWPQWLQKLLQPGVAHILNFQKVRASDGYWYFLDNMADFLTRGLKTKFSSQLIIEAKDPTRQRIKPSSTSF